MSWSEAVGSVVGALIILFVILVINLFVEVVVPWAGVVVMLLALFVPGIAHTIAARIKKS